MQTLSCQLVSARYYPLPSTSLRILIKRVEGSLVVENSTIDSASFLVELLRNILKKSGVWILPRKILVFIRSERALQRTIAATEPQAALALLQFVVKPCWLAGLWAVWCQGSISSAVRLYMRVIKYADILYCDGAGGYPRLGIQSRRRILRSNVRSSTI
jgi:hypothetical protein